MINAESMIDDLLPIRLPGRKTFALKVFCLATFFHERMLHLDFDRAQSD
jgi:hypothetical protein